MSLLTENHDNMTLAELIVTNRALDGRALRELRLPHDALVVMIVRRGERLIARGDTRLRRGDTVTLVGSPFALEQAARLLRA